MSKDYLIKILQGFDLLGYFEDHGIEYWLTGDNVSQGWVSTKCIFCNDHMNHLGINLEDKTINCWICGTTGYFTKYICHQKQVNFYVARAIVEKYQNPFIEIPIIKKHRERTFKQILPNGFNPIEFGKEPPIVKEYFHKRRLNLKLCQEYGVGFVSSGEYKLRLVVPVYLNYELVSFIAIDMTGEAKVPKLDCPEDRAKIINKHLLYGIDDAAKFDHIVIVEGIVDKWVIGKHAIALFGKTIHYPQLMLLKEKANGKAITIMLDSDAWDNSDKTANMICATLDKSASSIDVVRLEESDPADRKYSRLLRAHG